jgi:oligopeptide transport system substrate-binding protein
MHRTTQIMSLALALLAGACGGAGQREAHAPVVASVIGGAALAADPSAGPLGAAGRVLLGATAQGLVRFDAAGQIEPGLAERWIVIDDGRSYIFRLREAQWLNGEPVTAAQVVRTLRRAAAPGSRNALAPFLAVIDEIVEMTPQVIEVRLKRPRPDLLKLFAQPEMAVFRLPSLEGSGPFRPERRDTGILLRPVPDPGAVDPRAPAPEETVWLVGERAGLALARFKAGQSDLVLGGSFADWPIASQAGLAPANIHFDQPFGLFGLAVVAREGFLAEADNRAAVAMALDRAAITGAILGDWAPVETVLPGQLDAAAPPAQPAWSALPIEERRATARARADAWRAAHGARPVVRIALPSGPGATLLWGHLAASLLRAGIEPRRVGLAEPADLLLIDQVAPYDSGRWFVATACMACSQEARALIEAGREAPDLPQRARRIAEADAALTADSGFIPIAQPLRWSAVALRLNGWQRNTRAWHPLNHLRNETE